MFLGVNANLAGRLALAGAYLLLFAVAAGAQTAYFAPDPRWESPEPNTTRSVALGDIDLDGDLDLVCGNSQQANTLFLNDAGTLGIISAWFPLLVERTRCVALGDIDGDGDLDLVCGNFRGANTLYLNHGGVLATTPEDTLWTSNTAESVALGDLDNDGDLDVVFGTPLFPTAIFFNDAGRFSRPPQLIGGPNETRCVAIGDVDGDGYLDVVQGNVAGATTPAQSYVYLNREGVVDSLPDWSSQVGSQTLGIALADIDGDGRLDLICANLDQPATIYYHDVDSLYATSPSWVSNAVHFGQDVEVGDVDGDGDLDVLFFANSGPSTSLYVNDLSNGGGLATDPIWPHPARQDRTIDAALADIDGDGDLDFVCGNSDQLNTAYLNVTPALELEPSWESTSPSPAENRTKSVALGDIDGDGDLDLVCGNGGAEPSVSACYLNQNGRLDTTPSWLSTQPRRTASVALAKVNRDDRLDLVCGNQGVNGEESNAFENIGGTFTTTPTWVSAPTKVTTSVAVADVNLDGFVDLVCGNGADSSVVYLNLGSNFDTRPAWMANAAMRTSGIALGDVDGDGLVDLVLGNNGEPCVLYKNQGRMFAAAPAWSSAQAFFTNDVTLGDIDGDGDLDLVCANNPQATIVYFNQGGTFAPSAGWSSRPPVRATTSVALGDLDGDGDLDLVCGDELMQPNLAYMNEGGVLNRDPGWVSTRLYDTEDVALGDVDGDGDLDAVFGNELLPNSLHAGMKNPPYRGDPSAPTNQLTHHGAFVSRATVRRIGPNTHRIVFSLVDVESDPAWILVEYQFKGEPVWYRADVNGHSGLVGRFASAPSAVMDSLTWDTSRVPSDPRDIALRLTAVEVPARVGLIQRAPSYVIDVGQTPSVAAFARPSSGTEFFETRDILVALRLPPGVTRDQARLYYRRGGESEYQTALFEDAAPSPVATIPSDWVGARGIEYWVEAQTATETLTDPRTDPAGHPHAIRIIATNLVESATHPARTYRIMSIPLELESTVSIIRALQDDVGFPDATRWRLFGYDAIAPGYVEVPNDSMLSFEQSRGYWLITSASHRLDTAPVFGESAPTDSAFSITLAPGWNLIGHPFAFPVAWASLGVGSALVEPPVAWRGDHYEYDVDRLTPWEGYWVRNRTGAPFRLKIPPVDATTVRTAQSNEKPAAGPAWRVSISVSSQDAVDRTNVVGVQEGARTTWDAADRSDAPMGPGRAVSLYFPHHEWAKGSGNYTVDIRGEYEALDKTMARTLGVGDEAWGHVWRFDVAKNFSDVPAGDEVALEFSGVRDVPAEAKALLIDHELKRVIDVEQQSRYAFFQSKREFIANEAGARFSLIVGSEAFTESQRRDKPPTATRLHPNRPNPFNPVTIVRYEIAEASPVAIGIYDVSGAWVRDLFVGNRQPGIYEVSWNGTDDAGEPVASGVYFCRLTAGPVFETRKMVLLK